MPSIFGSDESSIFDVIFKKFFIFFWKSIISFFSNAFPKDSIGLECLIFLNLNDGLDPMSLSKFLIFFKNGFFLAISKSSPFNLSNSESEIMGLSFSK